MAALEDLTTGEQHCLSPRHLLGRAPSCQLCIEASQISSVHAELIWDGRQWLIRDLGSRNGTVLGTHTLTPGEQVPLPRGVELVLAGKRRFRLIDDAPPHLLATALDGEVRAAEHELLSLPSDDEPELTIHRDLDNSWRVESATGSSVARNGERLQAGGRMWQLTLPTALPQTSVVHNEWLLHALTFRFRVSRDQEHVELSIARGGEEIRLESRAHLSLLLLLARARLDDETSALPESERGWLMRDELPKMLGVEPHMPNLWVHRARKQLAAHGVRDAAAIIERRAGATQLRIGVQRLEIAQP